VNREHYEALSSAVRAVIDTASNPRATEAQISRAIDLVINDKRFYPDVDMHPNETGVLVDPETGRYVRFGAGGKGGGDYIGMFRRADSTALFIEAEIKRPIASSKQSPEQIDRERFVERMGGSYRVLRSVEDAERWIAELRRRYA
jgi:hypothetical protein